MKRTLKKISTFTKNDWQNQHTLNSIKDFMKKEPGIEMNNFLKFFEELGQDFKDYKVARIPEESYDFFGQYIQKGECHLNCAVISDIAKNQFDFFYGFFDNCLMTYDQTKYICTHQHSFLIQKEEKILFDPTVSWDNIKHRESEVMRVGKNYFGVYIPQEILERAARETNRKNQNISYYLKNFVFVSKNKTNALVTEIKELKNNHVRKAA